MNSDIFIGNHTYWHLNACVGNNGWTGISTYLEGYQGATIAMLESILKKEDIVGSNCIFWTYDTAIYPILFSARHSLELFLKYQIDSINKLKKYNNPLKKELTKTHNIETLWNLLVEEINQLNDDRLLNILISFEKSIHEYNKIDPLGETFRYPYSNEGKKYLEEHSTINFKNIYENYILIADEMQNFCSVVDYLKLEYSTGSYTKNLSRNDLKKISSTLPTMSKWKDESFNDVRNSIKEQYKISYKELSEAINIIISHHEFSLNIIPENYLFKTNPDILKRYCNGEFSKDALLKLSINDLILFRSLIEANETSSFHSEYINFIMENIYKDMNINSEIDFISNNYNRAKKLLTEKLNYNFIFQQKDPH
ncbi:hypothetical protein M5F00_07775 [Acinetobacter sp. ANC 4945]|uniref:Uncharacterized protein n=1 Tax=Acinetobacter amyesii TaxID=2942470 RepID=A0A1T1H141_9GAMM|nr:hypothetical protein [Acinetobacter amyesii]MCL6247759.1 hypothetical protein [Acinetobacter amyesii]OOV83420.1 hypothetical protein B1202_07180 [Acinetobacter amyesii]